MDAPPSGVVKGFLLGPGPEFDARVEPYRIGLAPLVARMRRAIEERAPLARVPAFPKYETYCRWPIRMTEYAFAMRQVPEAPSGAALDVGSGVTPWPYWLASMAWPVTAVDLLADEVAAMRRHGAETYGAEVTHQVADARGLGFRDDTFALVTSISVLEHVARWDAALALSELVRVCRPGGRIVLTTDLLASDSPFTEVESFTPAEFERVFGPLADACGLQAPFATLTDEARRTTFEDLRRYWTSHRTDGLWTEENRGHYAVGLSVALPSDPDRKAALAETLRSVAAGAPFPRDPNAFRQTAVPGGGWLWTGRDARLAEALEQGAFEPDVGAFLDAFVRPGDVAFDIGANVGHYTRLLAGRTGPGGCVHAFEPTAEPYQCLVRNTLAPSAWVRRNRFGLSTENGVRTIFLGGDRNAALNSFGEPFGAGASGAGDYETETVWTMTLDEYVRAYGVTRMDLVKLDVEGWEEHVVRGGVESLLRHRPILIVEYCSPAARNANGSCLAVSRLLEALGYGLYRYEPEERALEPSDAGRDAWGFANLVAVPAGRLDAVLARLRGADSGGGAAGADPARSEETLRLRLDNQALLRRLASGLLDREITALTHDSHARLAQIERLRAQWERLRAQWEQSEADRAARLEVIQKQDARIRELETAVRAWQSHPVVRAGSGLLRVARRLCRP